MSVVHRPGAVSIPSSSGTLRRQVPRPTLVPVPALRRQRVARFLTQEQLAERAGLARSAIARLEGGGEARLSTVVRLAAALDCEPEDLLLQPPPADVS